MSGVCTAGGFTQTILRALKARPSLKVAARLLGGVAWLWEGQVFLSSLILDLNEAMHKSLPGSALWVRGEQREARKGRDPRNATGPTTRAHMHTL